MDNNLIAPQASDGSLKSLFAKLKANSEEGPSNHTYEYLFMICMFLTGLNDLDDTMRAYGPITRDFQNLTIALSNAQKKLDDLLKKVHIKGDKVDKVDPVSSDDAKALWAAIQDMRKYIDKIKEDIESLYVHGGLIVDPEKDKDFAAKRVKIPEETIKQWRNVNDYCKKLEDSMYNGLLIDGKEPSEADFDALSKRITEFLKNDTSTDPAQRDWIRAWKESYDDVKGTSQLNTIITTINQQNNNDISADVQLTGLYNTTCQNVIINSTAKTIVQNYAPN